MKPLLTTLAALTVAATTCVQAQNVIADAADPFPTSFRGAANTTYFGWNDGSFDGASNDEIIDNPTPTLGTIVPGISLTQLTTGDILASSNNIYNGAGPNSNAAAITLVIPTAGTPNTGFTTVIVQGRATTGGPSPTTLTTVPSFGNIVGFSTVDTVVTPISVAPTLVWGRNSGGRTQWFVKYEIPGNAATYILPIGLVGGAGVSPTSIANLQVDTLWSETGYASDVAFLTTPPAPVVDQAPVLEVTGKTSRKVAANAKRITISGTATDADGIAGVYYSVGKGGLRVATGTTGWTIDARLSSGKNVITIFAVDTAGQVSAAKNVTITRR